MRRGLLVALLSACAVLATAPSAGAQAAGATAPTKGALYTDGQSGRYLMGGQWLYRPDAPNVGVADGYWRDVASTANWTPVTVPNSFNARDFSGASMKGSVGWYRRDFTLPSGAFARYAPNSARRWVVRFESVNYTASVWINGHELGTHNGAYLPFELDLKNLHSGVNRLVVRVDDIRGPGDFPPGPGGGWWNFGGIQREVYLRAVQRADVANVQVRPLLSCPTCFSRATIAEQATVHNPTGSAQTLTLTGFYAGRRLNFGTKRLAAGGSWTPRASVTVRHPHLWAPGSPYLYRATITLGDVKGRTLQRYTVLSGVRSIRKTADGRLELNGRLLHLRGVNVHEQNLFTGAALSTEQLSKLMGQMRAVGSGIIRAHYPLNPELEQAADRDGILLWSEVPVYQNSAAQLGQDSVIGRAVALLRSNILTNQNHPAVLLWSIGNELPTPVVSGEANYIRQGAAEVHRLDPTRPAAFAVSSWPGVACQTAYAPLDVIGYNDYFGWFDSGGGATDDRTALGPFLNRFHACYRTKSIFISEFGFDGSHSGPLEERGTYAFESDAMQYHLDVFAQKSWLSGAIYFPVQAFAAKPGYSGGDPTAHPPFVEKGVIDIYGNVKPLEWGVMSSIYHGTRQIAPTA